MFKRVALFLATNLAVLALVSVVMSVLRHQSFNQFAGLLVMAALFGFGGSIISLLISKWMAKRATGAHVITQPRNEAEQWLLATVKRQAQKAGIGMPEVAIYDAPGDQRLRHRRQPQQGAGRRLDRPAARDEPRRGRSRAGP